MVPPPAILQVSSLAHSAATGKYREPALLSADGGFWRHTVGSTALHVTGQSLEKAVQGRSTLGIPESKRLGV